MGFCYISFLLFAAHAAGAHPFSAAGERMQRERKGENHVPPFETPYKVAAAGLLKQPGKEYRPSNRSPSDRKER